MSVKALEEYVYTSKYARYNEKEKRRETWSEAVDRVKQMHLRKYPNVEKEINWAFEQVLQKRVLGSQRALQFGGKPIEKINERMYNCCASYCDRPRFFQETLFLLLAGSGVGFSVQKHHVARLPALQRPTKPLEVYTIPDSIEGWADALGVLIESYFKGSAFVEFDYHLIREEGTLISSGTGKAPGPNPLRKALEKIRSVFDRCLENEQKYLRPIDAYDIVMHASDAVLSGGVRRSATLAMFSVDDMEMATAKTGNWFYDNPQRARSNNSALLIRNKTTPEQFKLLMNSVKEFGEPGFIWSDSTEGLFNPCVEIQKYAYDEKGNSGFQGCNLCEINGKLIKTEEDFEIAARAGAIIGTLQAGYTDFPYLGKVTESIFRKEALLGVSITGMMENPYLIFNPDLQRRMAELIKDVNKEIAEKIGINPAARCTCIKPAGCQKKETMLITDKGILSFEEIGNTNGEIWQDHNLTVFDGKANKNSSKFFINGFSKTKKIIMESGVELESTFNHQYKIFRDGELKWVRADEISEGDVIPYCVGGYENNTEVLLKSLESKIHFNSNWTISPNTITEELAWLLGIYNGDGSNHYTGIRIHGNINEPDDLIKAGEVVKKLFGLPYSFSRDYRKGSENKLSLVITSRDLVRWLEINDLKKKKSREIVIPKLIRSCSSNIIKSYLQGYWCADGCTHKNGTLTWCTSSKKMSQQIIAVLRAVGQDCAVRNFPPTKSSFGTKMRYWIGERKGRSGQINKSPWSKQYKVLDDAGLHHLSPDIVIKIEDSQCDTFDIEVPQGNTYLANSYISHNSTSSMLGTSSGIHPHHSRNYFRRVQGNRNEAPLKFFNEVNSQAVEKSVWREGDSVLTFCVEIDEKAMTKKEVGAIQLLEYVKLTQQNWVIAGTRLENCTQPWLRHNVSNTINVKPHEWEDVEKYIYANREYFAGISLLPHSGDLDYPQAPFCAINTPEDIVEKYGAGSVFASGLIVDGLHAYKDLWKACDAVTGRLEPVSFLQEDWIRRAKQFADRYFGSDVQKMLYCLKEVNNWKTFCDLKREWKDVDYSLLREDIDSTKPMETAACSGGSCELI